MIGIKPWSVFLYGSINAENILGPNSSYLGVLKILTFSLSDIDVLKILPAVFPDINIL
ncbi:MAG: hypothetical protein AB8U25_00930 [Rickettsiales endosymbiont of Dermacentor nuttalli]